MQALSWEGRSHAGCVPGDYWGAWRPAAVYRVRVWPLHTVSLSVLLRALVTTYGPSHAPQHAIRQQRWNRNSAL